MANTDLPRALDRLAFLGQSRDRSIRPILLRVMVDMFGQKDTHSDSEIQQFGELVEHLLADADHEARLRAADKLARHPQTPHGLLERFLGDRDEIAEAVLAHADLAPGEVRAVAETGSPAVAVAAARRPDLDPVTIRTLAGRPEHEVLHALIDNTALRLDEAAVKLVAAKAAGDKALVAKLLERTGSRPVEGATLFLSADTRQRAAIITEARRFDLGQLNGGVSAAAADAQQAFERASRRAGAEGLEDALGLLLATPAAALDAIRDDRGGEPLALCFAAAGVSGDTAARLFILGARPGSISYAEVQTLVGIVAAVPPRTALRLLQAMLGTRTEAPRRAASPLPSDQPARRAAGPLGRADPRPAEAQPKPSLRAG